MLRCVSLQQNNNTMYFKGYMLSWVRCSAVVRQGGGLRRIGGSSRAGPANLELLTGSGRFETSISHSHLFIGSRPIMGLLYIKAYQLSFFDMLVALHYAP